MSVDNITINAGYRVHQGKLYDKNGYGIIEKANNIRLSKNRNPHASFNKINIGNQVFIKGFSSELDNEDFQTDENRNNLSITENTSFETNDYSYAIDIDSLINKFKK